MGATWVKASGIVFGVPDKCTKIAVFELKPVLAVIPEIQELHRTKPGPARKAILIQKATERLSTVVKRLAYNKGFDCVVLKHSIIGRPPSTPTDITQDLIKEIKNGQKDTETRPGQE